MYKRLVSTLAIKSLNQRILWSATLVLLVFIIGIALTLDRAFYDSARLGVQDRMFARLLILIGDAEVDEQGTLEMPENLIDIELSRPETRTYAFVIDKTKTIIWQSPSALSKQIPIQIPLENGAKQFDLIQIDNRLYFISSFGVGWVNETGTGTFSFTFSVISDTTLFDAQIERYREDLWGLLGIMALLLLIAQVLVLRWGLQPMRQVSSELAAIESGKQANVTGTYPRELKLLTDSINSLIDHERKQQKRYRNGLADLAHSLKTPLAILRGVINSKDAVQITTINEQVDRMDNIVQYQLRRAATVGSAPGMLLITLRPVVEKIVNAVKRAYYNKNPMIIINIADTINLRIDEGDLMELLGNLIDNAFKWCKSTITLSANYEENKLLICISDDGPGIKANEITKILERGVRADQSTPGHGIGLAIVRDIIQVYGGKLSIESNKTKGTSIMVCLNSQVT